MSDRSMVLTVILDSDYRICDDIQPIINAIQMVKGVVGVSANVANPTEYMALTTAKYEVRKKLWAALES